MGVAEAAVAAAQQQQLLADRGHVGENRLVVVFQDLGANGDFQDDVVALAAGAVLAHAMAAGLGLEVLLIAIVDQRVEPVDANRPYVAAAPAVAAVGSAVLNGFLTAEADGSAAAVTRSHKDFRLVQEFHRLNSISSGARVFRTPGHAFGTRERGE